MSDKWAGGFLRTRKGIADRVRSFFTGEISDDSYEDLMETLILADVSYPTAEWLVGRARENLTRSGRKDASSVLAAVKAASTELFTGVARAPELAYPAVILIAGVNGAGKTTTIAKLARLFMLEGKSVILSASDTFRAAASDQLENWADRLDVPVVRSTTGQDAAGIIFDALAAARARNIDVLLADTAGRLQNKKNLMAEFEKIYRVLARNRGEFNLYTFLVLDAMSGQNSLGQLESFDGAAKIDGIILTKTDGSAKGGVLMSIARERRAPIMFVGTGEGLDDLEAFDPVKYVEAVFGD